MRKLTDLYSRRDEEKRGSWRLFPHQLDVPFILWRRVHISFAITSEIPLVCHVSLSNKQNSKSILEDLWQKPQGFSEKALRLLVETLKAFK